MNRYVQTVRGVLESNELSRLDALGVLAFTAVVTLSHGALGLVAGVGVLVTATIAPSPAAFVVAQLVVVSLLSETTTALVAATQLAVFPLLVSGATSWPQSRIRVSHVAVAYVTTLGVVWLLVTNLRWVWQSALSFVVAAAAISYALHRYERVTLGLVRPEGDR